MPWLLEWRKRREYPFKSWFVAGNNIFLNTLAQFVFISELLKILICAVFKTSVHFFHFCRPHNDDEKRSKVPQVISCNESRREVTVIQNMARNQIDRTFTFDKVSAHQEMYFSCLRIRKDD